MSSLMTWYPCLSGPALQNAVLDFMLFSLQKQRVQACRSFLLGCICFRLELLSCLDELLLFLDSLVEQDFVQVGPHE